MPAEVLQAKFSQILMYCCFTLILALILSLIHDHNKASEVLVYVLDGVSKIGILSETGSGFWRLGCTYLPEVMSSPPPPPLGAKSQADHHMCLWETNKKILKSMNN